MAYLDEHGLSVFKEKIDEKIEELKLPDPPTTDGNYILRVTIDNGEANYAWVSAEWLMNPAAPPERPN